MPVPPAAGASHASQIQPAKISKSAFERIYKRLDPEASADTINKAHGESEKFLSEADTDTAESIKALRHIWKGSETRKELVKPLLAGLGVIGVVGTGGVISLMAINAAINASIQKKMLNGVVKGAVDKAKANSPN